MKEWSQNSSPTLFKARINNLEIISRFYQVCLHSVDSTVQKLLNLISSYLSSFAFVAHTLKSYLRSYCLHHWGFPHIFFLEVSLFQVLNTGLSWFLSLVRDRDLFPFFFIYSQSSQWQLLKIVLFRSMFWTFLSEIKQLCVCWLISGLFVLFHLPVSLLV